MDYKDEIFFMVVRVFQKNGNISNSIEYKTEYYEAEKRYYNIIAADLADENITYNAAYIINSVGRTIDFKCFDRRPVKPAPEPEPEEEPQEE
jgi:hypothetical protein